LSFLFLLLAALSTGRCSPAFNTQWLVVFLLLSDALFVVVRCPAIIDDCVASRRPLAQLLRSRVARGQRLCRSLDAVVLILLIVITGSGAGLSAGTKPWRRTSWSSSTSGHRCSLSGEARWQPDEAVRCATHPVMRVVGPPAAAGQSRRPSSSALPVSIVVGIAGIVVSSRHRVVVFIVAGPHNLHCCTIAFASAIAAAVAVATNAAAAALH